MGIAYSCRHNAQQELFAVIREGDLQQVMAILNKHPKLLDRALSRRTRLSALHYTASHGQADVLLLLLAKGASVNAVNHHRQTPLMLACRNGRVSCVERFVEWEADILMFDGINGRTCLHYAAKSGHLDCVQRVLDAAQLPAVAQTWGFSRFLNVRDSSGATPLHLAARFSHAAVVRLLLSKGSIVSATTTRSGGSGCGFGSTPLHFAARGGSTECVKELLAWGADRMQRNCQGQTPFFIAMKYNNIACASLLNPHAAEPLVWPCPWKFMSDLDSEAKALLEAALIQANDAWEKKLFAPHNLSTDADSSKGKTESLNEVEVDDEEVEMCCICFERACTIEVQDCGHQMCASCTLALCCHNKPSAAMPNSPAPACPFCRQIIVQLKRAEVKASVEVLPLDEGREEEKEVDTFGLASKCKKSAEGSSSIMGLVGRGSFRLLSSTKSSGRVMDIDVKDPVAEPQEIHMP
ncbi:hypothetical protein GOP47_0013357 [Adiantum capillus-veneris]|uniref:RING-type E3 ubiquitin transferase n=1 Tax=Adiantum capillus-veneris TaxID=13818 RepID=A0A9D4UNJ7_ADICA|nr:hypothetical protein GOP47_0013357 [Adiantum capillus-veneris]